LKKTRNAKCRYTEKWGIIQNSKSLGGRKFNVKWKGKGRGAVNLVINFMGKREGWVGTKHTSGRPKGLDGGPLVRAGAPRRNLLSFKKGQQEDWKTAAKNSTNPALIPREDRKSNPMDRQGEKTPNK